MIEIGRTFDGLDAAGHLFVMLSGRTASDRVVVANLTSHYPERPRHSERCLIVEPHEHQWVRRDSCIYIERTAFVRYSLLEQGLDSGVIRAHPRCSPQLLRRIQEGVLASPVVQPRIKAAVRAAMEPNPPLARR